MYQQCQYWLLQAAKWLVIMLIQNGKKQTKNASMGHPAVNILSDSEIDADSWLRVKVLGKLLLSQGCG